MNCDLGLPYHRICATTENRGYSILDHPRCHSDIFEKEKTPSIIIHRYASMNSSLAGRLSALLDFYPERASL